MKKKRTRRKAPRQAAREIRGTKRANAKTDKPSKSGKSGAAKWGSSTVPTSETRKTRVIRSSKKRSSSGAAEDSRLQPEDLRWTCPPISPGSRQPRISSLLAQDRPVAAIRTGLTLYAPGYNIFLSGTLGSGRTRLITDLIQKLKPKGKPVPDRVYVSNFQEPNRPSLITLPRGEGSRFREQIHELVHVLQENLRGALRSRAHRVSHDLVMRSAEDREKRLMAALDRQAKKEGFAVVQFPGTGGGMMADIYPIFEGDPVNPEAFRELVAKGKVSHSRYLRLRAGRDRLMDRLEDVTERLLGINHETEEELRRMDHQVGGHVLRGHLRSFARRWNSEDVVAFLTGLKEHVLRDLDRWVSGDTQHEQETHGRSVPSEDGEQAPQSRPVRDHPMRFLGVEVHVVKTSRGDECPVVFETHPTYSNLFGVVEPARDGHIPSLAQVHPGSLLRADGGYLILRLSEVMGEPGVWSHLKMALKVGKVDIREFDPNSGVTSGTLQPEAVPITLKVILIGDPGTYETLTLEDPQFLQTFKVHAEFDTVIPATQGNMRRYADLLDWFRRTEGLKSFSADANSAVVEYGARLAGRKDRLSSRFGQLADLAHEASHMCEIAGEKTVTRAHIELAIRNRTYRVDLPRESVERDYRDGYLLMKTKGGAVGQINVLTVIESDALMFGKPSRVTVATGVGSLHRAGVVNIERESDLSGPLHDKGVMILQGYLLNQFAVAAPLSLQATICFEQTYGGVDGDSASAGELCALLSSLTGVTLDQGFGVTGSINQLGVVQAVSGVNEKTEGFYRLCKSRKLSGKQGVILPRANVPDLMLDPEVVEAVSAGRFHIHAVERVDEMMEILTGTPMSDILEAAAERLNSFREGTAR